MRDDDSATGNLLPASYMPLDGVEVVNGGAMDAIMAPLSSGVAIHTDVGGRVKIWHVSDESRELDCVLNAASDELNPRISTCGEVVGVGAAHGPQLLDLSGTDLQISPFGDDPFVRDLVVIDADCMMLIAYDELPTFRTRNSSCTVGSHPVLVAARVGEYIIAAGIHGIDVLAMVEGIWVVVQTIPPSAPPKNPDHKWEPHAVLARNRSEVWVESWETEDGVLVEGAPTYSCSLWMVQTGR